MPTPQEFMERVVPWPASDEDAGYINLHWTKPGSPGMRGRPFKNVQDFISFAQWGASKPSTMKDIYFCLSLQATTGKVFHGKPTAVRTIPTALKLKAIWLDVDVKPEKGYATLPEAIDAIEAFVRDARMPPPSAIVLSGGGVHVYWINDVPLTRADWQPFADGLKAEALRLGLRCDAGLTTDAARVLRVPGTFNHKTSPPRAVRLAALGQSYNFGVDLKHLADLAPARPVTTAVTKHATAPYDLSMFPDKPVPPGGIESLAEGINIRDDRPLNPAAVFQGCPHFADATINGGKGYPQGLWALDLLAATFFEDGRTWAHKMSDGYSNYSPEETDKKFDEKLKYKAERGLGWPGCDAFESEGCQSCKGCVYKGKIRSPLNLAERALPPAISIQAPPPPADLMLPEGFTVHPDTGVICQVVQKTLGNGVTADEFAPLFHCKIRNPVTLEDPRQLKFECSLDKGRWGPVVLVQADLATHHLMMKSLCEQGVKVYRPNEARLEHFVTSWLAKIDEEVSRQSSVPFGWLMDGDKRKGFVYGGRCVLAGGQSVPGGYVDPKLMGSYTPVGSIDPWFQALKIVTDQKAPELEAIIATAFAAPLMFVPAQYNGMVCAWSRQGGAHKSTSIDIAAAVWGNPQRTKENDRSSVVGMMRRLGYIRNLPMFIDEVGDDKKMEAVRYYLTIITEGSGGSKLKQDRSFADREEWQSLVTIGANLSLRDQIQKKVKGTDAQLQRVFEFEVQKRPDSADPLEVQRLVESLNRNFGLMGLRYADFIGRNPEMIDKFTKQICDAFNKEVGMRSEERFRAAIAGTMFAGAALANQIGATFNLGLLYRFLQQTFLENRARIAASSTVSGTIENTSDILSKFFKDNVKHILWTRGMHTGRGKATTVTYVAGPTRERPEAVHVHCITDARLVHISRDRLSDFLIQEQVSVTAVIDGIAKHYNGKVLPRRLSLTAGVPVPGSRETVIEIPVPPGSDFEELLFTHTPPAERDPTPADLVTAPVTPP